jgi:urea transport system substrate-binding protein
MIGSVLIVDDDEDILATLATILTLHDYGVVTAGDGLQGLEAVERQMPDLVLLDLKMPVMNGWQFAEAYRARWSERAAIVLLSAVDDPAQRAQEVGAVAWIGKPFEIVDFLRVVAAHLRSRAHLEVDR